MYMIIQSMIFCAHARIRKLAVLVTLRLCWWHWPEPSTTNVFTENSNSWVSEAEGSFLSDPKNSDRNVRNLHRISQSMSNTRADIANSMTPTAKIRPNIIFTVEIHNIRWEKNRSWSNFDAWKSSLALCSIINCWTTSPNSCWCG